MEQISDLHETVSTRFELKKLIEDDDYITSRPEFYTWMDYVITQTYRHAQVASLVLCTTRKRTHSTPRQVLIDTNTYDKLDATRLVNDNGTSEKYWDLTNDSRLPDGHINADGEHVLLLERRIIRRPGYYIGWDPNEDLKRRQDYPYLMFVPLVPLVLSEHLFCR